MDNQERWAKGMAWLLAGAPVAIENGRYTGDLQGALCNGVRKLEYAEAVVGRDGLGIAWAESYAYSDGLPDLPLLERVRHPVVVDPDPELAAIADSRAWRVLTTRPAQGRNS